MVLIDPNNTWRPLEERLAVTTNPLHCAHLESVIYHMKSEALDDVDGVMSTVAPTASYSFYGEPGGVPIYLKDVDEIIAWYESQTVRRVAFEFDIDRLVVDDYCIITEGDQKAALYPGAVRKMGGEVDDENALYLAAGRTLVVWPFTTDRLLSGEVVYRAWADDGATAARNKMDRSDVAPVELNVRESATANFGSE